MHLLVDSREFFGVNAPLFAWLAAVGVLLGALTGGLMLAIRIRKMRNAERVLSSKLKNLSIRTVSEGLSLSQLENLKKQFQGIELLERCWTKLQGNVVRRRGLNEDEY